MMGSCNTFTHLAAPRPEEGLIEVYDGTYTAQLRFLCAIGLGYSEGSYDHNGRCRV